MNNASGTPIEETIDNLTRRSRACGWMIMRMLGLGVLAAVVAAFGEDFLTGSRLIFPLIDQNYMLWQSGYVGGLVLIGLLWAAALLQRVSLYQDCRHHITLHRRLREQAELKARRALEVKLERQEQLQQQKLRQEAAAASGSYLKNARSSKFDY